MDAIPVGRYMTAEKQPLLESTWTIRTRKGDLLGMVEFYPDWRQFIFSPRENTVFSTGCLQDLIRFINQCKGEKTA